MLSFETIPLRLDNPTLVWPNSPLHIGSSLVKKVRAELVLWSILQRSVMTIQGRPHTSTTGTFISGATKKGIIVEVD